jgi:hypothetical protein
VAVDRALSIRLRLTQLQFVQAGVQEMTRRHVGLLDGFTDADRDEMLYEYFWAASEVGGHFPPVRSLVRIFFRRRNLQVFTSNVGAAKISVLQMNPKLTARIRRARFGRGARRHARGASRDSGPSGAP